MKMAFDLVKALATVAPTLSSMLLGPLAGTAVSALATAFGLAPDATPEAVTQVVQAGMTPDAIAKVREQDQLHAEKLRQMDIDVLKLNADHEAAMFTAEVTDREGARNREAAVRDNTPRTLAYGIIGGFFVMSGGLMYVLLMFPTQIAAVPAQGWVLVGSVWSYLGFEAKAASSYYFGTTKSSGDKNEMLFQSMPSDTPLQKAP
jgi:hypothetical protein